MSRYYGFHRCHRLARKTTFQVFSAERIPMSVLLSPILSTLKVEDSLCSDVAFEGNLYHERIVSRAVRYSCHRAVERRRARLHGANSKRWCAARALQLVGVLEQGTVHVENGTIGVAVLVDCMSHTHCALICTHHLLQDPLAIGLEE